jgi:hypothetical protein
MDATSGIVRIPTPSAAAMKLNPWAVGKIVCTTFGLIHVRAKNPSTTLGMPARISRIGLMIRRVRGLAYSER